MRQPGVILKKTKFLRICPHCCEVCHRPSKRKVRIDKRECTICRTCDRLRRRHHRGKDAKHCWQPIYYWIEGKSKSHHCKHGSSRFVVIRVETQDSTIVCTLGYVHRIINGFRMEKLEDGDEWEER